MAAENSPKATKVWIGLVDPTENGNHTADCDCWEWLDGSPYNYENYAPNEPNNLVKKEWCMDVYLPPSGLPAGTWNDENCEDKYVSPALCSVPAPGG